jgi:hypothetical protein
MDFINQERHFSPSRRSSPILHIQKIKQPCSFLFFVEHFGLVADFAVELGFFSLKEFINAHGPLGLQIGRDLILEPKTLKERKE